MNLKGKFRYIFFDADDTLWENERYFRAAEAKFIELLADYTTPEGVQDMLWRKQEDNIPLFGYGSKTYMIGRTDAALELCGGNLPEQMGKFRISGLAQYFHHCEVMENKDEKNWLEVAAKHNLRPEEILMIGNSVKSDIAPVVSLGGWAIHTPHEVVWVHEMMDMPENDRIIEVKNIREILGYLI